ncbi:MAG: orotidine-5'-phosphate decarboxylase [Fibrobacter sp.]|jgi:orotidine-5'-phosphate decarboxylase|nr:orotidine-5'-phosphate decarboxylase [Fibrobacter sp.]
MNTPFSDRLESRIIQAQNPICFGMDPVLNLIPIESSPEEKIKRFYFDILEEMLRRGVQPAVIKPNSAYYESLSIESLIVLKELISAYEAEGMLSILDAKRGDIGKSSAAYAEAAFNVFNASAVTVSPWMGEDSVGPFLNHSASKGVYTLLRTSNKGAEDFQDLVQQNDKATFFAVAQKLIQWDNGNLGAVVGATKPQELEEITRFFVSKNHEIPFLIPGVSIPGVPGGQGGDAQTVFKAIKNAGSKRNFHVFNSSSGLSFAWQATGKPQNYASACVDAIEKLSNSFN